MKLRTFLSLRDPLLADAANAAATTIASAPANFGVSAGEATTLATRATLLDTKVDEVAAAKIAYEMLVKEKNEARASFSVLFQSLMAQAYASLSVSDVALLSVGLDAREPVEARPVRQPLDFKVEPSANGYIAASWKRNRNTSNTVFHLQMLSTESEWEEIWSGTRIKVSLTGFTPGEERTFRVIATKGEETSVPSNNWTIYGDGSVSSELRIAA